MVYSVSEKVFIGGLSLIFCIVLIGFTALIFSISIWAKNKKLERIAYKDHREANAIARHERDREEWMGLLGMKDDKISELTGKLNVMTRKYQMTKQLLEQSEKERLGHGKEYES